MENSCGVATVNNDRDHGSFSPIPGGERGWQETNKEFLNAPQQLLHDYGDLLVEQGLLLRSSLDRSRTACDSRSTDLSEMFKKGVRRRANALSLERLHVQHLW